MRAVAAVLLLVACNKQSQDGLPPATDWQSDDPTAHTLNTMPSRPRGVPNSDPHAGIGAGGGGGGDPHAGVPGAPPLGGDEPDPHAGVPGAPPLEQGGGGRGMGGGTDVTQLGLQSPDPNRAIDPSRHIKGQMKLAGSVKDRVAAGASIFLMVRKQGADGQPMGSPIAVDRVEWSADGMTFELTEKHAMVQGAPDLVGDLVVMARVDQDQDAMTKQPGDVTGMTKVKIPATGVVLQLDTVLP